MNQESVIWNYPCVTEGQITLLTCKIWRELLAKIGMHKSRNIFKCLLVTPNEQNVLLPGNTHLSSFLKFTLYFSCSKSLSSFLKISVFFIPGKSLCSFLKILILSWRSLSLLAPGAALSKLSSENQQNIDYKTFLFYFVMYIIDNVNSWSIFFFIYSNGTRWLDSDLQFSL